MKILALDLSTRQGSIAMGDDDRILFAHESANDRRTAAPFFEALARALLEQGKPDSIVVGLGPGSYTGTRIAISSAIGLCATTGASLRGLPSVVGLSSEPDFVAIGDAKRATYFWARVCGRRLEGAPELLSAGELSTRMEDGRFYTSDELPQFPRAVLRFPQARLLWEIARAQPENLVRAPLTPIYLREPHITK